MARKSKLSDAQWRRVEERIKAGESVRSVAKDIKMTEGAVRKYVSTHCKPLKQIAQRLADIEVEIETMPISTQVKVRTIADELKDISHHLAGAAKYGAMTAHRLSSIAHVESNKIDDTAPLADMEALKGISVLTTMANNSSEIGMNLLRANKDAIDKANAPDTDNGAFLKEIADLLPD